MRGKIILKGMQFHAFHGLYEEERKKGNNFSVDISLETDLKKNTLSDNNEGLLDYSVVYEIIREEMGQPRLLLEALAFSILERLRTQFQQAIKIQLRVAKYNPPIGGTCQEAAVELQWPE